MFNALDGRNTSSVDAGLGGFLQCATYATGLSGGSWFLSSWAIHDAPSPAQLVLGSDSNDTLGWHLENGLLVPDGVLGFFGDNQDYYDALEADVNEKQKAGFNVSITDLWGRALAYHFAPGTTDDNYFSTDAAHGVGYQFSDIAQQPSFVNHNMPFPLVVANLETKENIQPNSTTVIPLGNTVFSFSPYEFGSFDPMLSAFIPTQLTGTALNSGRPQDDQSCVNGFEEFSFIIGTSSSLFNAALHLASQAAADSELVDVLFHLLGDLGLDSEDADNFYALYPNSFRGVAADTFGSSDAETLLLVDGGENGENVPLNPVLASAREVDVIFAIDSSADTEESWPNGTALLASKERTKMLDGAYTLPTFPESAEEFVGGGFNARPTFFGCQESESAAPLVVYMPNAPGTEDDYDTNTSTFKLQYDVEEASAFINTIQMTATRGKAEPGKKDDQYPACLACAVFERGRVRAGLERSDVCKSCLKEYCVRSILHTVLFCSV